MNRDVSKPCSNWADGLLQRDALRRPGKKRCAVLSAGLTLLSA